jgi:hypothetical protein
VNSTLGVESVRSNHYCEAVRQHSPTLTVESVRSNHYREAVREHSPGSLVFERTLEKMAG